MQLQNLDFFLQIMLNSFTELLLPDRSNSYIFDSDLNKKPFGQDTFDLAGTTETGRFNLLMFC